MKILMVCLGNICRSPLAEGILRQKTIENQHTIIIDSAGTIGIHAGEQPDKRMQATALKYGIDLSTLHSRQITLNDFQEFDRIYAMDESNYSDLQKLARNEVQKAKVRLLLDENPLNSLKNVPDPYYGGQEGFEQVYFLLEETINHLINNLKHDER
jgi:protein-tyrosine phosphatase